MAWCPKCETKYSNTNAFCPNDGEALIQQEETTLDPFCGLVLDDRYRIDELIGAGAMGRVYRATQLNVGAASPQG